MGNGKKYSGGLSDAFLNKLGKTIEESAEKKIEEALQKAAEGEYEVEVNNVKGTIKGTQLQDQLAKNLKKQLDGTEVTPEVTVKPDVKVDSSTKSKTEKKIKAYIKDATTGTVITPEVDFNNKSLKERLEYLKMIKAESKFMLDAEERKSDMEEKAWDAGGNRPKSEADSLKKIKTYEDLCEHIEKANSALDEFNDKFEKVVISYKDGTEKIVGASTDFDKVSLALDKIKDVKFVVEGLEEAMSNKTDDSFTSFANSMLEKAKASKLEFKDILDIVTEISKLVPQFETHSIRLEDAFYDRADGKWSDYGIEIPDTSNVEDIQRGLKDTYKLYKNIQKAIKESGGIFKNQTYDEEDLQNLKNIFAILVSYLEDAGGASKEFVSTIPKMTNEFKDLTSTVLSEDQRLKEMDALWEAEDEHLDKSNKALRDKVRLLKQVLEVAAGDDPRKMVNSTSPLGSTYDYERVGGHGINVEYAAEKIAQVLGIEIPKAASKASEYVKKSDEEIYASALELANKKESIFKEIAEQEIAMANKTSDETRKKYVEMATASKKMLDEGFSDYDVQDKIKDTNNLITELTDKLKTESDPEAILSLNEQLDNAKVKILALQEVFNKLKFSKEVFSTANLETDTLEKYWRKQREYIAFGENKDNYYSISSADKDYWKSLSQILPTEEAVSDAIRAHKEELIKLSMAIDEAESKEEKLYKRMSPYDSLNTPGHAQNHAEWIAAVEETNKIVEVYNETRAELYNLIQLQDNWGRSIENCAELNRDFLSSEWREEEQAMNAIDHEIWDLAEQRKKGAKAEKEQQQAAEANTQSQEEQRQSIEANTSAQEEQRQSTEANTEAQNESQQESRESAEATREEADAHEQNAEAIDRENKARRESNDIDDGEGFPEHGALIRESRSEAESRGYIERINDFINKQVVPVQDKEGNTSYAVKYLLDYQKAQKTIVDLDEKIIKQAHDLKDANEEELPPMLSKLRLLEAQRKEAEDWIKKVVESPESEANESQLEELGRIRAAKREQLQAELRIQDAQAETARAAKEQTQAEKEAAANERMLQAAYGYNADRDSAAQKKAQEQLDKDWNAAILENIKKDKEAHDAFLKDWDDAIEEDRKRVADMYSAEDLEYLDKRTQYLDENAKAAAEYAEQEKKIRDARTKEYENIFYNGAGKLNEVEFAPNTEALRNSNALYDELEASIKRVYDLKEANLKLDKETNVGADGIAKNNKEIEETTNRIVSIVQELNAAEAIQESRERALLEIDQEREGVLKGILNTQELQSRDDMASKVAGWVEDVEKLRTSTKYTQEFNDRLDEALKQLKNFDSATGSIEEVKAAFEDLNRVMHEIDGDKTLSEFKKAASVSISKLDLQITEFMRKNSRMGKEFRQEFENLKIDWDAEHSLSEVQQLADAFAKLKTRVTEADKLGANFFDTLRQRAMGVNAQLIAQYLSWQDLIRYARQAVEVIKELDYALIDLKKTTTMNSVELKEFYFAANDVAKQTGVTTEEIISQAAAWSRLNN